MSVLISANGRPTKPGVFFFVQFGVTLIALPAYYLAGGLLNKDAWAFAVAICICFLVFGGLRKALHPQFLSLSIETEDGVRFKGKFEEGSIPYSDSKALASARMEPGRLILQTGEGQPSYSLTIGQFQPGTLAALATLISQAVSGGLPDPAGFPDSVRVGRYEHRGNVVYLIGERPSGALLQFIAFSLGIACFFVVVGLVR